jgi:hypothetical protein
MTSLLLATALSLATPSDARWAPFWGCWTLIEDEVRRPVVGPEDDASEEERPMGLTCLAPEGEGVRLTTYSGDEAFLEEALVADGQRRELVQGRCHGYQALGWSRDSERLFTRLELTCEENRHRSVTGVSMLVAGDTWVEIQSMGGGDGRAILIRRFRAAGAEVSRLRIPSLTDEQIQQAEEARSKAASALGVDDVIEVSSNVAPEVAEAVLVERGSRLPVDGETLLRLSEASVPPRVIDLLVALAYPDAFSVERAVGGSFGGYSAFDPYWTSAFAYPYYFAPFGYYYGYAPWYPIYRPPIAPGDEPEITRARAVEGRGYTRVTRASPSDSEERRAHPQGSSWDNESGSSGSSSGSVSRQGYSRSGGAAGATAKPKKQ